MPGPTLRISEVARRVGISSSALRAWETLGLVVPQRTASRYRLYTERDVRLLQRAIFLRRARGMNPTAIVHILKRQGIVSPPLENASAAAPGQRFRRLRTRRGLSRASRQSHRRVRGFSQRDRAWPDALLGRHPSTHRAFLSHEYSFVVRSRRRKSAPRAPCAEKNPGDHCRRPHGVARLGQHRHGAAPVSH